MEANTETQAVETVDPVQEVFGQFATEINGKVELFATREEATGAAAASANAAEWAALAAGYCAANNLEGKNAAGKTKIILGFLAYQASA